MQRRPCASLRRRKCVSRRCKAAKASSPRLAAKARTLSVAFTPAPWSSSAVTTESQPFRAASCSGVRPVCNRWQKKRQHTTHGSRGAQAALGVAPRTQTGAAGAHHSAKGRQRRNGAGAAARHACPRCSPCCFWRLCRPRAAAAASQRPRGPSLRPRAAPSCRPALQAAQQRNRQRRMSRAPGRPGAPQPLRRCRRARRVTQGGARSRIAWPAACVARMLRSRRVGCPHRVAAVGVCALLQRGEGGSLIPAGRSCHERLVVLRPPHPALCAAGKSGTCWSEAARAHSSRFPRTAGGSAAPCATNTQQRASASARCAAARRAACSGGAAGPRRGSTGALGRTRGLAAQVAARRRCGRTDATPRGSVRGNWCLHRAPRATPTTTPYSARFIAVTSSCFGFTRSQCGGAARGRRAGGGSSTAEAQGAINS